MTDFERPITATRIHDYPAEARAEAARQERNVASKAFNDELAERVTRVAGRLEHYAPGCQLIEALRRKAKRTDIPWATYVTVAQFEDLCDHLMAADSRRRHGL